MILAETIVHPELLARRLRKGLYRRDATTGDLEKRCSHKTCAQYLPADTEFFFASRAAEDGLNDWCKACTLTYQREHRAAARKD